MKRRDERAPFFSQSRQRHELRRKQTRVFGPVERIQWQPLKHLTTPATPRRLNRSQGLCKLICHSVRMEHKTKENSIVHTYLHQQQKNVHRNVPKGTEEQKKRPKIGPGAHMNRFSLQYYFRRTGKSLCPLIFFIVQKMSKIWYRGGIFINFKISFE